MLDTLTYLPAAITVASVLGVAWAAFYAAKTKTVLELRKEEVAAYKERNTQLEADKKELIARIEGLEARQKLLEDLKTPPLKDLTKLLIQQHTEQMESNSAIALSLTDLAKSITHLIENKDVKR